MESADGLLFLETEDVVAIHRVLMDETHPAVQPLYEDPIVPGILDRGAIYSAVERHRWGPFTEGGSLEERASYLLRGIAQDHPFTDGNKRTAFEATDMFLRINGSTIDARSQETVTFLTEVARGLSREEITGWLASRVRKI